MRRPDRCAICASSVVTVLLPLVPVIPTTGAVAARANSSMSPDHRQPARARGVEERTDERHAGRDHHQVGVLQQRGVKTAGAHEDLAAQLPSVVKLRRLGATVRDRDLRATREQVAHRRIAALAHADHDRAQRD